MPTLDLSPDELLSTTRAVRKRLDFETPVPIALILECIGLAQQAPTGSNTQSWQFVVVTDPAKKQALGAIYRRAFDVYRTLPIYAGAIQTGDADRDAQQARVASSADYLADHLGEAPALVIPCIPGRAADGLSVTSSLGSIMPAAWSFMLAARARGLGTCWTTLHLMFEEEAAAVVGIPYAEVSQVLLTPVAFTKGTDFKPAMRPDPSTITHIDTW
jgi:nitroreductase